MLVKITRLSALFSYLILFLLTVYGIVSSELYPNQPRFLLVITILMPLVFPAKGLFQAKRYTHAWTCYIALYYLMLAVDLWMIRSFIFSVTYFLLAIVLFFSAAFYARLSPLPWREKLTQRR